MSVGGHGTQKEGNIIMVKPEKGSMLVGWNPSVITKIYIH